MAAWVVMSLRGAAFTEAWRGEADGWFNAVEQVPSTIRSDQMFAVKLSDIHFVRLIDAAQDLPDVELVRTDESGALRRMRAQSAD